MPAEPAGDQHTHNRLERFSDDLAEESLEPVPQRLHVVRETGHQLARSLFAEVVDVEVDDIAVQAVPQVKKGEINDATDERFLPEFKKGAHEHAEHDDNHHPDQGFEGVAGKELRKTPLGLLVKPRLEACGPKFALQL